MQDRIEQERHRAISPGKLFIAGAWSDAASEYLIFPVTGNLERMVERGSVVVGSRDGVRTWARA